MGNVSPGCQYSSACEVPCGRACTLPEQIKHGSALATALAATLVEEPDDYFAGATNPAGAVFEETLEGLGDLERQLLLFSAGSNLVAVRWILLLGADVQARDSNGTSALHTACRTGSVGIVTELVQSNVRLNAGDCCGWTALHIAVFMCRCEVVVSLLKAQAGLLVRNYKDQTPLDLCTDALTREAMGSYMSHQNPHEPWHFGEKTGHRSARPSMQYEPFVLPQRPAIEEVVHKKDFLKLGMHLFNEQPGKGLSFLVASGCIRGSPAELGIALQCDLLDLAQIGNFLGEPFSLSRTLCLELMNSVEFRGTSVVSGLAKAFMLMQIPPDFQKIDRLVHTVAQIWWRQHRKAESEKEQRNADCSDNDDAPSEPEETATLNSQTLRRHLSNQETLYQLMFSVVMLHRNIHGSIGGSGDECEERVSMTKWLELNRGLGPPGSLLPQFLDSLYKIVSSTFIPQLAIRDPPCSTRLATRPEHSLVRFFAKAEGWVTVPSFSSATSAIAHAVEGTEIVGLFSETVAGDRRSGNRDVRGAIRSPAPPPSIKVESGPVPTWMSLCYTLLLFSSSCSLGDAPYAFVHLPQVRVEAGRRDPTKLSLVGNPDSVTSEEEPNKNGGFSKVERSAPRRPHVVVVFLLPDGRWQDFRLPRLDIQTKSEADFLEWKTHIEDSCMHGTVFI